MNLKTGDRVKCINATGYLVEGQTYTVKETFGTVTNHNSITVNECVVNEGFKSYGINRFEKLNPPNLVSISNDDLEYITDAFLALDYFSEGTYINLANLSGIIDKIENQVRINVN